MTAAGLGQTNFNTRKVLIDHDGNVKIGRIVCSWHFQIVVAPNLIFYVACAAYSEQWQNHATMLVPLVHQLMYPWDNDTRITFHSDKWSKDSTAVEFCQTLLQPNTDMDDLLAVRTIPNHAFQQTDWLDYRPASWCYRGNERISETWLCLRTGIS